MAFTADFNLSITRALSDQLAVAIDALEPAPLSLDSLGNVEAKSGVYQLFHLGELVYTGKADRSLQERLKNHYRKIIGRVGISVDEVSFVALYVNEDLSAVAPETLLIKRHRLSGVSSWNQNGFGNKDPGRRRDTSRVKPGNFDDLYPVDLNWVCDWLGVGRYPLGSLLDSLKQHLPFLLRFEDDRQNRPAIYARVDIDIPSVAPTVDEIFHAIAAVAPGWQITALPGYVIMYRETKHYESAIKTYESTSM